MLIPSAGRSLLPNCCHLCGCKRKCRGAVVSQIGKRIADKQYLHVTALANLDGQPRALFEAARALTPNVEDGGFNVVRIRHDASEVSLLLYPAFFDEGFPALARSWRVHVPSALVTFRDYSQSLNPPILHRKELLLAADHPERPRFALLTETAESLGLFEDPSRIGFAQLWQDLIAKRGYRLDGHDLVPIGNADSPGDFLHDNSADDEAEVQRHLTALSRSALSAPIQSLLRHDLLRIDTSFFDYGCGKGDDLAGLVNTVLSAGGWDPYFRPAAPRHNADVVNLGFVINVIEDFDERIEALINAFDLCRHVLVVSAMLKGAGYTGRSFRDGVLTGRKTFQKYYTQGELQEFIESVLDEPAFAVAPGIFYVFKDRAVEQNFHARRSSSRTRVLRARLPRPERIPRPRRPSARPRPTATPEQIEAGSAFWAQCLDLGRIPDAGELANSEELLSLFGSIGRALRHCLRHFDRQELERSASARKDELRVFFAMQLFSRRRRFNELNLRLQRDVRAHFGSLTTLQSEAQELLYAIRDVDQIAEACRQASELGLGWLEPGHALHLHSSLIERLPALLRVYVGCATVMYGDLSQIDLIKLHLTSGKVTLMKFDKFDASPVPAMIERIKVRLRDQAVDIFSYGEQFPCPLAYRKSRFINEEFPNFADQVAFDDQLEALGLFDLSGFGPSAEDFRAALAANRWVVDGFSLARSRDLPALDTLASPHITYRELIECSDTWQESRAANYPSNPDTYSALADLCRFILEPTIDYFGSIRLTYGFCSRTLTTRIRAGRGGIEPRLDQHASYELNTKRAPVCARGGAAVDFIVEDEDMREVADWIAANLPFDRLYFYGPKRPLHVSYGPEQSRAYYDIEERNGRRLPRPATRLP